jgi:menaquinone-dependent protoporphyrinogen oxidase
MMKILITYASAHGTTQSIAERIESCMNATNIGVVTVDPIEENPHLGDFDVIIIGSAIHNGSWLPPATRFMKLSTLFLKEQPRPTWVFSVGMPAKGVAATAEEHKMEKWLKGHVEIRGHTLFQGRWQQGDLPWGLNWLLLCFGGRVEDRRDWDAIDKWADSIVQELRVNPPKLDSRHW